MKARTSEASFRITGSNTAAKGATDVCLYIFERALLVRLYAQWDAGSGTRFRHSQRKHGGSDQANMANAQNVF
jgi:hypothetical protein